VELNEITKIIVDSAYQVHTDIGPGLLESVYEILLADALEMRGLQVARQVIIPIRVGDRILPEGFRADVVVNGLVLVEIKSVDQLQPVHKKQVLTYLKLTGLKVGLLINFNGERLKGNIERLVLKAEDNLLP
jgi:GxxExxY protein